MNSPSGYGEAVIVGVGVREGFGVSVSVGEGVSVSVGGSVLVGSAVEVRCNESCESHVSVSLKSKNLLMMKNSGIARAINNANPTSKILLRLS